MAGQGMKGGQVAARVPQLSEDTIRALVEQQARETDLRTRELQQRTLEMQHTAAHAKEILGAQERDREAERTHQRGLVRDRMLFGILALLAVIGLICFGLYMGKDQLIGDLVKVLAGVIAGAFGGWGAAKSSSNSQQVDKDGE